MNEDKDPSEQVRTTHHVVIEGKQFDRLFESLLDRIEALERGALTPEMIAEAFDKGIGRAAKNPENWCAAAAGLRAATERQAGPWLVQRGAWQAVKFGTGLLLLVFVLATGGPTAAWTLVKSWFA